MGSRMAADLQKNRHPLVLFNRTPAKAQPLVGPCGTLADSPATLAEQVHILFTMLANPAAVQESALGDNGFLDHLRSNAIWVDCSSVNPSFSKRMAAEAARRSVRFVDAPVTGSAGPAAEAKLRPGLRASSRALKACGSSVCGRRNSLIARSRITST